MENNNDRKTAQLGMNASTAAYRLRQMVTYKLATAAGLNRCYRCGETISSPEEMSLDHKKDWMYSTDPKGTFFDLDNVVFSHRKCNCQEKRCPGVVRGKTGYKGVIHLKTKTRKKRYQARIWSNEKIRMISLGLYETAEEAAAVYDTAAEKVYGDKAMTNKTLGLLK